MTGLRMLTYAVPFLFLGSTTAYSDHWDLPSCYIDVHDGCFNDTRTPCSREDYEGFLDDCDDQYSKAIAVPRPSYTATLPPQLQQYQGRRR